MKTPPPPPPKKAALVATRTFRTRVEPWMSQVVAAAIEAGQPLASCAGLIGVTKQTIIKWRQKGLEDNCPEPLLVDFAYAVEEARAKAIAMGVQNMQVHAQEDWRAQAELLRAMDPETFAPQQRSKVEVELSPKAPDDLSVLSDDELEMRAIIEEKLAAARALPRG